MVRESPKGSAFRTRVPGVTYPDILRRFGGTIAMVASNAVLVSHLMPRPSLEVARVADMVTRRASTTSDRNASSAMQRQLVEALMMSHTLPTVLQAALDTSM